MASVVRGGRQVQVLKTDGHVFELDVHALGQILLKDHVKDKPVVVVAVAGAYRKGKSLLLSFLLRYLQNNGGKDWLGDPNAPLEGFEWRCGSDPHTTGILVWDEVFMVKTAQGRELAVLLMDTQGAFDCKTAAKVRNAIFALSTLLSSVLVYNVSQNIQEDDLEHLQLFTEYSRLAQFDTSAEPFQKLLFLVRDWAYKYETAYGAEGGQVILERRLEVTKDQDAGLRLLRERLQSCFAKITCFLMPHPGKEAATSPTFRGCISEIDKDFTEQLLVLAPSLLAPETLLVKEINGQKITCQQLMAYFEAYVDFLKTGAILGPQSAYEATVRATNLAAMYMARDLYLAKLLKVWDNLDWVKRDTMESHHCRLKEEAKDLFENTRKLGGPQYSQRYMDKLTGEIEAIFQNYSEYFKDNKKRFVDSVAFKAAHAVVTTGVVGAAVTLAVVELPVIAAVCGAVGAASLTGYVFHTVNTYVRKRKEKSKRENRPPQATTAEEACDSVPQDVSARLSKPRFQGMQQRTQASSRHQLAADAEMSRRADESQTPLLSDDCCAFNALEADVLYENFANENLGK